MRAEDEASAIARMAARSEQDGTTSTADADAALSHARTLRYNTILALRAAMRAHEKLVGCLREVVEYGVGVDGESLSYPDDVAAFDLAVEIDIAQSNIMRWVASLEGKESLARLMLQGPPGAGLDGAQSQGRRRVMVSANGHCWEPGRSWELGAPGADVSRASFEDAHGEVLELTLVAANADDPDSLWQVDGAGVRMMVPVSLTRDYAALYRAVVAQQAHRTEGSHDNA